MAIIVSEGGSRELVPAGLHLAICTEMIEMGTSEDRFGDEVKPRRKIWLSFEVCSEIRTDSDGKPYCLTIGSTFTASLGSEAKLRKFLESWRSKPFTADELKSFDLKNVLGKPCTLSVVHKPKSTGTGDKAEITSINTIMKGTVIPAQVNPARLLEFDSFDWNTFNALPDFLSKEVRRSAEFEKLNNGAFAESALPIADDSEPLPF